MPNDQAVIIVGEGRADLVGLADTVRAETGLRGVAVACAASARSLREVETAGIALAVIDADLPDGTGYTLCADLVRAHKGLPVMMVGGGGSEHEALRSLEAGAIDYVPRPQQRAALLARLRAHLRSQSTSLEVEITIGPFSFFPGQRCLVNKRTGGRTWLTAKETRLLRRLHRANGRPVPTVELIGTAWSSSDTSTHTLHTHVYRLRMKLGLSPDGQSMLRTIQGGYALFA